MYKIFTILIAGSLMTGTLFAQETSTSVKNILDELSSYSEDTAPVPPPAEELPLIQEQPVIKAAPALEEVVSSPEEMDVEAVMDASHSQYIGGEFERAQIGFEAVVKRNPENMMARIYLRKLLERNHRLAEVQGMKAVDVAWDIRMVQRSYTMSRDDAFNKMELEEQDGALDVSAKFPEVDFPKGATAIYRPKVEKVFVRNTRENLEVLEEILDAMDVSKLAVESDQVEIETKFIEVSEGTLEELGFEWDFANTETLAGDVTANDGAGLFASGLRGGTASPALPFARPGDLDRVAAGVGDWTAFNLEDTFSRTPAVMRVQNNGSTPLDVLISALDQSSGTDVLSAPRIVTKNGETAMIRVGQLHSYPEVYETGANDSTITHVLYEDFEEKLMGVELEVTPNVDGGQIELELNPKITELAGWNSYEVAPANSTYTTYTAYYRVGFDHEPVVARLPIFKRREINTAVTIADGGTIGMGGLTSEKTELFEDRVPFLGSLPLVGRLFRNEGERMVKRNLLIFVTARTVGPSGRINTARSF